MSSPPLFLGLPRHIAEAISEHFERIQGQQQLTPDATDSTVQARDVACIRASCAFRSSLINYIDSLHSDLRFNVNGGSRINQLPEDILIHILSALPMAQLVSATHVCHRWRKLGLSAPSLWTPLELTDSDVSSSRAAVLLERSKAAAIDIIFITSSNLSPRRANILASLVASHLSHVRSLSFLSPPTLCTDGFDPIRIVRRRDIPKTASLAPPGRLIPAPCLEKLRIDAESSVIRAFSLDWADTAWRPSFTCSALRELYLSYSFPTLEFLENCRQLRVLDLHIPHAVTGHDVLRILYRNPWLRVVKLWIPFNWPSQGLLFDSSSHRDDDDDDGDNPGGGTTLLCNVQHLTLLTPETGYGWDSPTVDARASLFRAIQFFTSRMNLARIPVLEVVVDSLKNIWGEVKADSDANMLASELLAHLHDVTSVELTSESRHRVSSTSRRPMPLRFEDSRGFARTISPPAPARPLEMVGPFLARLRILRMGLDAWIALAEQHPEITELPSLEELGLRGQLADFANMPCGGVVCPRLNQLSLMIERNRRDRYESQAQSQSQSPDEAVDDLISTGKTVALDRLSGCPRPLPVLTLVCEADVHFELKGLSFHCRPPEPTLVHMTWAPTTREQSPNDLSDSDSDSDLSSVPRSFQSESLDLNFGVWD